MARENVTLRTSVDNAWPQLQRVETWDGVAGIENLRAGTHDEAGNLTGFAFEVDTAIGRVDGTATVDTKKPGMVIRGQQKGLAITIQIVLSEIDETSCWAGITVEAKATSLFSKPLALALNAVLADGLAGEAGKIEARVQPT